MAGNNANNAVNLQVKFLKTTENLQIYHFLYMSKLNVTAFQMKVYRGCVGLSLKIPVSNV